MEPEQVAGNRSQTHQQALRRGVLMIAATLLLTIVLLQIPSSVFDRLGNYGYLGVFVMMLLANATIVLPSPTIAIAMIAARSLDPTLVGLVSGVGSALGETTGYLAGNGGSALVEEQIWYRRIEHWMRRWGGLTVFVLAFVPGPGLDLAGIAAGTLRLPFLHFLLPCLLGKSLRFILIAWLGRYLG